MESTKKKGMRNQASSRDKIMRKEWYLQQSCGAVNTNYDPEGSNRKCVITQGWCGVSSSSSSASSSIAATPT